MTNAMQKVDVFRIPMRGPGDVAGDRVVRHAAHGDGLAALLVAGGQCDLQLARARDGVLEEEFVEVAEAEEEERAGVLPLQLLVLPQHRRERGVSRRHVPLSLRGGRNFGLAGSR